MWQLLNLNVAINRLLYFEKKQVTKSRSQSVVYWVLPSFTGFHSTSRSPLQTNERISIESAQIYWVLPSFYQTSNVASRFFGSFVFH